MNKFGIPGLEKLIHGVQMKPQDRLQEIEKKFHIAFENQGLHKDDTVWLINRVKQLTEALEKIGMQDITESVDKIWLLHWRNGAKICAQKALNDSDTGLTPVEKKD